MSRQSIGDKINGFKIISQASKEKWNVRCLYCRDVYAVYKEKVGRVRCRGCGKNDKVITEPVTVKQKRYMKKIHNERKAKYLAQISTMFYKQSQFLKTGRGSSQHKQIAETLVTISKGDLSREI